MKVLRCNCGRTVAEGSVFCSHCRAEINRRNAKTMLRGENNYQNEVRVKKQKRNKLKKKKK